MHVWGVFALLFYLGFEFVSLADWFIISGVLVCVLSLVGMLRCLFFPGSQRWASKFLLFSR